MTYKNIQFGDSEVMRSLERLTLKKSAAVGDDIKVQECFKLLDLAMQSMAKASNMPSNIDVKRLISYTLQNLYESFEKLKERDNKNDTLQNRLHNIARFVSPFATGIGHLLIKCHNRQNDGFKVLDIYPTLLEIENYAIKCCEIADPQAAQNASQVWDSTVASIGLLTTKVTDPTVKKGPSWLKGLKENSNIEQVEKKKLRLEQLKNEEDTYSKLPAWVQETKQKNEEAVKLTSNLPAWVQETMKNKASNNNLSENIVKLCSGLRSAGFHKHANEIEIKYLNLKSAETSLYNMMKEKGEDMIEMAHPDGSHSLKNMEGDSIVENLLDQSKKIREVVSKNPKGKLSSAQAINMVKIAVAPFFAAPLAVPATGIIPGVGGAGGAGGAASTVSKLFPSVSRVAPAATGFLGQEVGVATFTGGAGAGTAVAAGAAVLGAAVAGALVGKFLGDWYMEKFQNSNLGEIFTSISESVKIASDIADSKDQNGIDNRLAKFYYRFQESHKKMIQDASTIGSLVASKSVDKASISSIDKFYDNLTTAGFNCSQLSSMVFSIRDEMSAVFHPINANKYQNILLYCKNYMDITSNMAESYRSSLNELKASFAAKEAEVQKAEQAKNPPPAAVSGVIAKFKADIDDAIADLTQYAFSITHGPLTPEEKQEAFKWLQDQKAELEALKASPDQFPENRREQFVVTQGQKTLNKTIAQSKQFETDWVN